MHITMIIVAVKFSQSSYRVDENSKQVKLVLVLSNPSSSNVTVTVQDSGSSLLSESTAYTHPDFTRVGLNL